MTTIDRAIRGGARVIGALLVATACTAQPQPSAQPPKGDLRQAIAALEPGQSVTQGQVTITMLQKQAGEPGRDGWYSARSRGTGFRVDLPAAVNELTTIGPTTDGGRLESNSLGGATSDGQRFSATCMRRVDAKPLDVQTDQIVRQLEARGKVVRRWAVRHGELGGSGIEIAVSGSEAHFRGEFFGSSRTVCQLTAESTSREPEDAGSRATRFFASFVPPPQQR